MYKNYFRVAIQNMVKNKLHAFINVAGLASGMAIAFMISLWIYDEVSYNKNFTHYERIGRAIQNATANGEVDTWTNVPWPLGNELRQHHGADFKYVSMVEQSFGHTLEVGPNKYSKNGLFCEPDFYPIFDVTLMKGTLPDKDPSLIMLSESTALAFFGDQDPIGQTIIMNGQSLQVGAVYEDFPPRSRWTDISFIGQWSNFAAQAELDKMEDPWRPNSFELYVMLADGADFTSASARIKDSRLKNLNAALAVKKPEIFLHAMPDWHLRAEFSNGKQTGGLIQYVWMFGIVAVFVLLMACINFMNLSTARSEKRSKEIGLRKAVGAYRSQLITQFFSESILTVVVSLVLALIMTQLLLPVFNTLAEKDMSLPWTNPLMWAGIAAASITIGLLAGSYPALYLSSIRPVGALKGAFKTGRGTALPRKIMVVIQFSVSAMMIIGTTAVYLQMEYGKNRSLGYRVKGLISIPGITKDVHDHYDRLRQTLISNGSILDMTECIAPTTGSWGSSSRIDWQGKDPNQSVDFMMFEGSTDYGNTLQWEILQGRDFSRDFPTDTSAVILNEEAAKYLDKKDIKI